MSIFTRSLIILSLFVNCNNLKDADLKVLETQANDYYIHDEYDKAVVLFDKLLRVDPNSPEYHFKRGRCLMVLLDDYNARKEFKYAISKGYRKGDAIHNLATTYLYENPRIALNYYKEALIIDSSNEKARLFIKLLDSVLNKGEELKLDSAFLSR